MPPPNASKPGAAFALVLFLDWLSYVRGQPVAAAAGLAAALRPAGAALASFAKDSGLGPELAKALPAAAGALPGGAGGFQSLTSQPSAAHAAADAAAAPVFSGEQSILATVPGGNGHSVFGRMGSAPGTPLTAPGSAAPGYAPEVYKPSSAAEPGGGPSAASGDRLASTELVPGAMAFPGSGAAPKQPLYPTNDEGTGPAHVGGGGFQPLGTALGGAMGAPLGQAGAAGGGLALGGGGGAGGGGAAAASAAPRGSGGASSLAAPLPPAAPGGGGGGGGGGLPLPGVPGGGATTVRATAPGGLPLTVTLGRRRF